MGNHLFILCFSSFLPSSSWSDWFFLNYWLRFWLWRRLYKILIHLILHISHSYWSLRWNSNTHLIWILTWLSSWAWRLANSSICCCVSSPRSCRYCWSSCSHWSVIWLLHAKCTSINWHTSYRASFTLQMLQLRH